MHDGQIPPELTRLGVFQVHNLPIENVVGIYCIGKFSLNLDVRTHFPERNAASKVSHAGDLNLADVGGGWHRAQQTHQERENSDRQSLGPSG
jgi:hypothetical protein